MAETSRGWQQLVLKPEVWNDKRGVSVCANLSSTQASIDSPRGVISAQWACVKGHGTSTCLLANEHDTATLSCGDDKDLTIKSIDFASFGTPTGSCGNFSYGNCSATDSKAVVSQACLGKNSCSIDVYGSFAIISGPCPMFSMSHVFPCFPMFSPTMYQPSRAAWDIRRRARWMLISRPIHVLI